MSSGFDAKLRVSGLIVGKGGMAHRLGYRWARSRGPWFVRVVVRGRREPRFVPWDRVRVIDGDRVVVSGSSDELGPAER